MTRLTFGRILAAGDTTLDVATDSGTRLSRVATVIMGAIGERVLLVWDNALHRWLVVAVLSRIPGVTGGSVPAGHEHAGTYAVVGHTHDITLAPHDHDGEYAAPAHTHTEGDVTDLDKYTQAAVDGFLSGKAAIAHGHALDDLSDVDVATVPPSDGDSLVWNQAQAEWQPGTLSGGSSYYEPLTDGVVANPQLIFADGDIIMVPGVES